MSIAELLERISSPEQKEVIIKGLELLSRLGVTRHEEALNDRFALQPPTYGHETYLEILSIVHNQIVFEIHQFGITLNRDEEADLEFYIELLEALYMLDKHDDPEEILALFDGEESHSDIIVDVLRLTSPLDEFDILKHVSEVSPLFLLSLRSTISKLPGEVLGADYERVTLIKERTLKAMSITEQYYSSVPSQDEPIISVVRNFIMSTKLGFDLNSVINVLYLDIMEQDKRELAAELVLLSAASSASDVYKASTILLEALVEEGELFKFQQELIKICSELSKD